MKSLLLGLLLFCSTVHAQVTTPAKAGAKNFKTSVANPASLPLTGNTAGDSRVSLSNASLYIWDGASWQGIVGGGASLWGAITGTLSNQTDLNTALNGKEPTITAATAAEYFRGDKTFQTLNTTAVPEGTNLYFTNGRFDTRFGLKTTTDLAEGTNLYYTDGRFDTRLGTKSTTDLAEGTNLYYTQARFDTAFTGKNTSNLSEGSNLYYTQARFDTAFGLKTTDNLAEGLTNQYFTNARARAAISVTAPMTYNSGTGVLATPNFIGDNFGGSVSGLVPAASSGQGSGNYYLNASGIFNYVDSSKDRMTSFALQSQTSQPIALSKLSNVSIMGNYAYVAGAAVATLSIYDISNQKTPVLKSTLSTGTFGSYRISPFTSGGHSYVAIPSNGAIGKLLIVNVDNPSAPSITTTFTFSGAPISVGSLYECEVPGNGYIYIASQSAGLLVLDIGGGSGSIASPVAVFQESSVLNAVKSFGITSANGKIFTTQYITSVYGTRQLKSWDITTPSTPSLLQSFQVATVGQIGSVSISGNTAVAVVNNGAVSTYNFVDVSNPSAMANISQVVASGTAGNQSAGIISGNYAYLPSGSNATDGGYVDFYDITTLASPVKISTVKTGVGTSAFGGIALNNGFIYGADYGPAPGSSGALDVFTAPTEILNAGKIIVSKITLPGGDVQTQINTLSGGAMTSLTGDVTGTGPGATATTLASVGTAGTYTKVTTDAKGRVISGTTLASGDIPNNAADTSGNAATATILQTARTINGVSFNGSANITIPSTTPTVSAITSNTTLASTTRYYLCDTSGGAFTVTLPAAASNNGVAFTVKHTTFGGANDVTVATGETIDGEAGDTLTAGEGKTYISNGTSWFTSL